MKLFRLNRSSYTVEIDEEAYLIAPFKSIIKRDKDKSKKNAIKELAFVWFYADVSSDYRSILDEKQREKEIISDLELPDKWKRDQLISDAIDLYKLRSKTAISASYDAALVAAEIVNRQLIKSEDLIDSSNDPILATKRLTETINAMPKVMQNLKEAEKQLIQEINDMSGKKLGSYSMSTYEDGLDFEE
jgi:hypothetical protein